MYPSLENSTTGNAILPRPARKEWNVPKLKISIELTVLIHIYCVFRRLVAVEADIELTSTISSIDISSNRNPFNLKVDYLKFKNIC